MVKWIQAIEFVENVESINQGEGGYNEDHEYFGELAKHLIAGTRSHPKIHVAQTATFAWRFQSLLPTSAPAR